MATLGNFQPTISTASTTTDATGNVLSSAVYVFNAPCDLSQLRDVNLAGATLHFTSAVDVQKLKDLNLKNAKLIFNNTVNKTTLPLPPKNPPAAPKKARAAKSQKNGSSAAKALSPSRTNSMATEYPRSYLKDEDLRAAMQSKYESIDNAIHPDRLSVVEHSSRNPADDREPLQTPVVDHGAKDLRDALEPGEIRDDVVRIKTEPGLDHGPACGFSLTQDTLNSDAAGHISPFVASASQGSPGRLDMAEASLVKLETGIAKTQDDVAEQCDEQHR